MKKIILSLAIIASSVAAFAQTNTAQTTNKTAKTEQTKTCTDRCKDKKDKKADGKQKRDFKKGPAVNAFEGITLTEAQKSQLETLRNNRMARRKNLKEKNAPEKGQKQQLTPEQRKQMMAERQKQRQSARKDYLNGVKQILTPEQYIIFLENNFTTMGVDNNMAPAPGRQFKGNKDFKKGHGDRKHADKKKDRDNKKA